MNAIHLQYLRIKLCIVAKNKITYSRYMQEFYDGDWLMTLNHKFFIVWKWVKYKIGKLPSRFQFQYILAKTQTPKGIGSISVSEGGH